MLSYILVLMLIPVLILITEPGKADFSIIISAIIGIAGHCIVFIVYRYFLPDIRSLSAIVLSACIIVETAGGKILTEIFDNADATIFFLIGFMTIGIFTITIIYLRKLAGQMEGDNA